MGLNYSIAAYIAQERLADFLDWLYDHSSGDGSQLTVIVGDRPAKIKGYWFRIDDQRSYVEPVTDATAFNVIHFSMCLIFDIDPDIIKSLEDWTARFGDVNHYLDDFREMFESSYLGNGKIRVGAFDGCIRKLNEEVYDIYFSAVTSDMSRMLNESLAVRKWLMELNEAVHPIVLYLSLESEGNRVLHYRGRSIDTTITNWDGEFYDAAIRLLDASDDSAFPEFL